MTTLWRGIAHEATPIGTYPPRRAERPRAASSRRRYAVVGLHAPGGTEGL